MKKENIKKLRSVLGGIKQRCLNKNSKHYENYGGRGIKICDKWLDFDVFYKWSINNGYAEGLSIDRINTNGDYSPNNCRWTTKVIQARNRKQVSKSNTTGYKGVTQGKEGKYLASIGVDNKVIYLGTYSTKEEAAKEYNKYIIDNKLEHSLNKIKGYNMENQKIKTIRIIGDNIKLLKYVSVITGKPMQDIINDLIHETYSKKYNRVIKESAHQCG